MAKVIAIANHKGGCGKTTSTINIGAALAAMKHSTLLVDLDPQANLTISMGIDPDSCEQSIYTALAGGEPAPMKAAEKLDVITANSDLVGAELELVAAEDRERRLERVLEPLQDRYQYILLDCPPSMGLLTLNALTAADAVAVPLQAQYLALHGLAKIQQLVGMVQQNLNGRLSVPAVFLTQYDSRKVLHRNTKEMAEGALGRQLCKAVIRDNVALAEAPTQGQTIYQYAPKSNGAADYMALAKELRTRYK